MFTRYYAIARRHGQWVYIASGTQPEDIYREAIDIIEAQEAYARSYLDEGGTVYSPMMESMLDTLRVVPEETAKEHYHVTYPHGVRTEEQ